MKLVKENLKFILVTVGIWIIAGPVIFIYKDRLYSRLAVWYSPPGYNAKVAHKFMSKGKSILEKKEVDLGLMADSCRFHLGLNHKDAIFYQPTWLQENRNWTMGKEKERSQGGIGNQRAPLPTPRDPKNYWSDNISETLEALDYFRRALNFSGPETDVPISIDTVAFAACRPSDAILAYSTYLINTEDFVLGKIREKDPGIDSLSKKIQLTRFWSQIKNNHFPDIVPAKEFIKIVSRANFFLELDVLSPGEADQLLEMMIFFAGGGKEEKNIRMRRGRLLYKLGETNPSYYDRAIVEFKGAIDYSDLRKFSPIEIRQIQSSIFEGDLWIARCLFGKKDFEKTLKHLQSMQSDIHRIDGREGVKIETELLKEYNIMLKRVLRKLKR
ncbi:MAG: hypothetical protein K8R21_12250 [Leptospira sp.]|nr:hypothetical protein [Leptospira sp.]